jgi:hypothetical protein
MKTYLALASMAAALYLSAAYTRPETAPGQYLHNTIDPAVSKAVRYVQRLPYVRLLDWDGVNDYQPRPTIQPLEVVSPASAGYTPEELAEIYPTH